MKIKEESPERFSRQVVIVQDAFTSYFETQTVVDLFKLLKLLEFEPSLMPLPSQRKTVTRTWIFELVQETRGIECVGEVAVDWR